MHITFKVFVNFVHSSIPHLDNIYEIKITFLTYLYQLLYIHLFLNLEVYVSIQKPMGVDYIQGNHSFLSNYSSFSSLTVSLVVIMFPFLNPLNEGGHIRIE